MARHEEARRGNTGAALVGLGILLFFIAYLAWQYQDCYQYTQLLGSTYCTQVYYPYRPLGLYIGFIGFGSIIGGLVAIGRGS